MGRKLLRIALIARPVKTAILALNLAVISSKRPACLEATALPESELNAQRELLLHRPELTILLFARNARQESIVHKELLILHRMLVPLGIIARPVHKSLTLTSARSEPAVKTVLVDLVLTENPVTLMVLIAL